MLQSKVESQVDTVFWVYWSSVAFLMAFLFLTYFFRNKVVLTIAIVLIELLLIVLITTQAFLMFTVVSVSHLILDDILHSFESLLYTSI